MSHTLLCETLSQRGGEGWAGRWLIASALADSGQKQLHQSAGDGFAVSFTLLRARLWRINPPPPTVTWQNRRIQSSLQRFDGSECFHWQRSNTIKYLPNVFRERARRCLRFVWGLLYNWSAAANQTEMSHQSSCHASSQGDMYCLSKVKLHAAVRALNWISRQEKKKRRWSSRKIPRAVCRLQICGFPKAQDEHSPKTRSHTQDKR